MASEPATSPNPYTAPNKLVTTAEDQATRCSFCDRPASEVGSLVENPGCTAYICRKCAQTTLSVFGEDQSARISPRYWMMFAVGFIGLGKLAPMLWDWVRQDGHGTEYFGFLVSMGVLFGVFAIGSDLLERVLRWRGQG